jgi:hypothetical protein
MHLASFVARSLLAVAASVGITTHTSAQIFNKVADVNDVFPLLVGNFTDFGGAPSVELNDIYFIGNTGSFQGVVKSNAGILSTIVNEATVAPLAGSGFDAFSHVAAGGDRIAFNASASTIPGIYGSTVNQLFLFGSTGPTTDGQPVILTQVGNVSMDSGTAVFWATVQNIPAGPQAIFRATGRVTAANIAIQSGDLVPGAADVFTSFGRAPVSDGVLTMFTGKGTVKEGLYTATGFGNGKLLDNSVFTLNGSPANYQNFRDQISASVTETAFIADLSQSSTGVRAVTLTLNTINRASLIITQHASSLDTPTAGFGQFTDFMDVSLSTDGLIFTATGSALVRGTAQQGLFAVVNGSLLTLADRLTTLDGKLIESVTIGNDSIDASLMAFRATFTDGSSGIYSLDLQTIPVPGVGALALLVGLTSGTRRPRRSPLHS